MKHVITIGLTSLVLVIGYSFVYACDHSNKVTSETKKSTHQVVTTNAKTIRTLVVGATTGCPAGESVVSFDIDVPGKTSPRFIHIEAREAGDTEVREPSALRTAMTLGRALVTAFGAVMGELLDAATGKTASLV